MTAEDKKPNGNQLKHLSIANMLEEGSYARLLKQTVYFIGIILFLLILWTVFTRLDEVAVSYGEVQPVKEIESVQHLEGGIVKSIQVNEGDLVEEGQTLIVLDDASIRNDLERAEEALSYL